MAKKKFKETRRTACLSTPSVRPLYRILDRNTYLELNAKNFASHRYQDCYNMLNVVSMDKMVCPYIVFRCGFLMIEASGKDAIHPTLLSQYEMTIRALELNKPDAFLECLAYLIRNNHLREAREFFDERSRYMRFKKHKFLAIVMNSISCYEAYLHYLNWLETRQIDPDRKSTMQGVIQNLSAVLSRTKYNHDFFLRCLLHMQYDHSMFDDAGDVILKFIKNNPDNLTGYLCLYESLRNQGDDMGRCVISTPENDAAEPMAVDGDIGEDIKYDPIVDSVDVNTVATEEPIKTLWRGLTRLDPSNEILLKLMQQNVSLSTVDRVTFLMDQLEYIDNFANLTLWSTLVDDLETVMNSGDFMDLKRIRKKWINERAIFWHRFRFSQWAADADSEMIVDQHHRRAIEILDDVPPECSSSEV